MSQFLTPLARSLPSTVPFTGPETLERRRGHPFRARLGANESGFGPSPAALAAMQAAAADVWMYGDPENHDLKQALAQRHGCATGNIVVGPGVDGLLGLLCRLVISPGTAVVSSLGAYPTFNFHVAGYGGVLHLAPYVQDREDPQSLLDLARHTGARLIYIANPDNPMGTRHPAARIEEMVAHLPPGTLLLLDEAYVDLAPEGTAPQIPVDHPQVIRFRTFSKAYGMAGARVGYAIGPNDMIGAFDKVRDHFGMCRISQAGALAALGDTGFLPLIRSRIEAARSRVSMILEENGLIPLPSATNFVTADCCGDGDLARRILAECGQRGLFIRMPGVAPLDRCIRVSLGPDAALDVLEEVLPQALQAARG